MRNLGMAYSFDGRHEDADRWTRRAADAGLPDAMFDLGVRRQHQGPPDEAEQWYRQAANRGRADAMAKGSERL